MTSENSLGSVSQLLEQIFKFRVKEVSFLCLEHNRGFEISIFLCSSNFRIYEGSGGCISFFIRVGSLVHSV